MKASDLLARCLEHEGVEWVFGIPGEETLDVMDSLLSSQVKFVLTKHESSAAFMAETIGRLTRRPGVCMATLGPGAANLVSGVADAYLSCAPMVALAGQRNARRFDPPSKQVLDLVSIFRPITKDSISLRNTDNLPVLVRKAFDTAVQERPGPVFMELPEDLMGEESAALPQPGHPPECVRPERSSFHQLAETIKEAEAPLVIAGYGVVRGRASEALVKFCHAWNLPVVHTWMATGAVPSDDSCSMSTIGARTNDRLRAMYEKADLVIIIGADLSEFPPTFWNIGRRKESIYFGQVPLDHFENFVPEVQVIGGLRYMLEALAAVSYTHLTLPTNREV